MGGGQHQHTGVRATALWGGGGGGGGWGNRGVNSGGVFNL